jgi:hypothetical protein
MLFADAGADSAGAFEAAIGATRVSYADIRKTSEGIQPLHGARAKYRARNGAFQPGFTYVQTSKSLSGTSSRG